MGRHLRRGWGGLPGFVEWSFFHFFAVTKRKRGDQCLLPNSKYPLPFHAWGTLPVWFVRPSHVWFVVQEFTFTLYFSPPPLIHIP